MNSPPISTTGAESAQSRLALSRRTWLKLVGASAMLPALASTPASAAPVGPGSNGWSIVALPDTQHYSENINGGTLTYGKQQTQWIANNLGAQNIKFVSHEGDLVEHGANDAEWSNISSVMATLDGKVPYSVLPGNHDFATLSTRASDAARLRNTFPPSRFGAWYGGRGPAPSGSYPGPYNLNSYQLFSAGGYDFLHLALEWEPPGTTGDPHTPLGWAQQIIDAYPKRAAIITTHAFVQDETAANGYQKISGQLQEKNGFGNRPSTIWRTLVQPNPTVFMVLGGHFYRMAKYAAEQYHAGEGHLTGTNNAGSTVFLMLGDYQWKPHGGDGWLRVIQFLPGGGSPDRIRVLTYSPALNQSYTDDSSQFTFDLDFAKRFPARSSGGGGGGSSLPAPWQQADVGAVAAAGSTSVSGSTFTVAGSGSDIYGSADECHFVYQAVSGDGEIVARVASQEHTNDFAKAGVMIRESLAAGSKNAFTRVSPSSKAGTDFQYRTATGGSTSIKQDGGETAPEWLRLVRTGNTFTGYKSADGTTWTAIGSTTVSMGTDVLVGVAVSSHKDGTLGTVRFENVTVGGASGGGSTGTAPSVSTNPVTDVTQTSATLQGTLSDLGGSSSAQVWFAYWPQGNQSATTTTTHQTVAATGPVQAAVTGLSAGTTYVVQAHASTGSGSAQGSQVTFTTAAAGSALPAGWADADVGDVSAAGSASASNGTFTVEGSGADIYGTGDEFHFVYRSLAGDGEIVARVASQEHTNDFAKAGVMIRETLTGGAKNAFTRVSPSTKAGTDFQYRSGTGATTSIQQDGGETAPEWLRLVRTGNTFTGYRSADGTTWTQIGATSISMASTAYVGLAVCSHKDGTLGTATFSNVTVG